MIRHELLPERGILILKPEGALRAEDFTALAGAVDPYIEQHGDLNGPDDRGAVVPGLGEFRGAGVPPALRTRSSSPDPPHRRGLGQHVLAVAPKIASHFVSAELRTFEGAGRAAALAWIEAGSHAADASTVTKGRK